MAFIVTGGHWEDQGYYEDYSNPQWDAGARTIAELTADGSFTFTVGQATGIVCGFNDVDNDADYLEIDHAFYIENGIAKVIENGVFKTSFSSYSTGALFKIERIDGVIRYYVDSVLLYTSLLPSTGTVFLDCSLFAARDTIILNEITVYNSSETLEIVLPKPTIGFNENDDTANIIIELSSPSVSLEELSVYELYITLPSPKIDFLVDGESQLLFNLPKPSIYIREALIVPDYATLQFSVPKPQLRLNEEENLSLTIDLTTLDIVISEVSDFCHIELPKPIVGLQDALQNFFFMEWPQWSLSFIVPLQTIIRSIFQCSYQQRKERLFSITYSLNTELSSIHESSYDLLTYDYIKTVFETKYRDSIQAIHQAIYSDYTTSQSIFTTDYVDAGSISLTYSFDYTDGNEVKSIFVSSYSNTPVIQSLFFADYNDTTFNNKIIELGYGDTTNNKALIEVGYADAPLVAALMESSYSDFTSFHQVFSSDYSDFTSFHQVFSSDYSDFTSFKTINELSYSDKESIQSLIEFGYTAVDLAPTFAFTYGLLDSCESIFTTGYQSEAENLRSIYLTSYALNDEDIHILTGSCWIELDSKIIDVNEVSINADEGSSYYQCSATIINEVDYRKFVVDTEFTVHLFSDEYKFLVDSKNLSRSIDDEGHLSLQMTIEGLSPVVRYAAPRSLSITKTWDQQTLLSAFIEELIGPVDYQVVDDYIPAYRLSADNAIPLDLAKATMESIGALIESLPDGSIKVRKLWPTSIIQLNTLIADYYLNDENLFSMSEAPENNDWRNQFRIIDVDSSVQDTLEFVADEENNLAGTLYAYPSPWRDGLTLRHTRGTPIYLGALSEELVEMTVDSEGVIEAELIEFQEGEASTRYPIESILSWTWLAADLGAVAFVPHTKALKSSAGDGYSLAQIRYTSRRLKVRTSSSEYTSAQYLLEER